MPGRFDRVSTFIEEPRYQGIFEAVEKAAAAADLPPAERFSQRAVLLTTALKRNEAALGGEIFDGKALDKQGRVQQGKVALIGPVAMFASSPGDAAGLLQQELNKADPTVVHCGRKGQRRESRAGDDAARANWRSIRRWAMPSSWPRSRKAFTKRSPRAAWS